MAPTRLSLGVVLVLLCPFPVHLHTMFEWHKFEDYESATANHCLQSQKSVIFCCFTHGTFVLQGLFDGPRPVLLESCSVQDLAMLLSGSRRQASRIEFGAHQVTDH